jgi:hypothetical protein
MTTLTASSFFLQVSSKSGHDAPLERQRLWDRGYEATRVLRARSCTFTATPAVTARILSFISQARSLRLQLSGVG